MICPSGNVEMYSVNSVSEEQLSHFDELIERDYEELKCKARRIIGSRSYLFDVDTLKDAACTLIADTYHEAKQKFAQFNPACGSFVTWYGGFMRLMFCRMLRSGGQRHLQLVQSSPGGFDPPTQHPSFQELDDDLIRREMVEGILTHSHLDPFERLLVALSYWQDWQGSEIAQQFHVSPDYLRAKLQRTLRKALRAAQNIEQNEETSELILLSDTNRIHKQHDHLIQRRVARRA